MLGDKDVLVYNKHKKKKRKEKGKEKRKRKRKKKRQNVDLTNHAQINDQNISFPLEC